MICMWQCVHIYVCSHDLYWLAYNMNTTDIYTHIYIHIFITWYCICICVLPLCLSATMFAGLQELEEDMIGPFTLRHAANAGVLNKRTTQSTNAVLKLNVHFRPDCPRFSPWSKAIFNRVSICDHCCATMPNVSGRAWNKKYQKCKCLQEILLHITPQAIVWQNSQWWENAYLYAK